MLIWSDGGRTEAMRSLFGPLNDPSSTMSRGIFTNLINPKLEQSKEGLISFILIDSLSIDRVFWIMSCGYAIDILCSVHSVHT